MSTLAALPNLPSHPLERSTPDALPQRSGLSPAATAPAEAPVVDDPLEWRSFSQPVANAGGRAGAAADEGDWWSSGVVFEGITCAACALDIEAALVQVPGVRSAVVSAANRRGRVVWSAAQTQPSQWLAAAAKAGYPATPAGDASERQQRQMAQRHMTWRWLVSCLCMMQVMMFAGPAYFAQPGDLLAEQQYLLRWASWVLCLPLMLFSCGPFFRGAWHDLRARRVGMDVPVALGMLIAFVVSTLGTFEPAGIFGREVYFDSLSMFVCFLLTGRWLELRLRERSACAVEALLHRMPEQARRQTKDGTLELVSARRLKPGDVVQVMAGETFVGDGEVLHGHTLVDEALLTGESRPRPRGPGAAVLAGSHNLRGTVQVRLSALGAATRLFQLVELMADAALDKPQLAQLADRISKPFLMGVLLLAALGAALWWPTDPAQGLMVAVAVLIVTCPCALSLATPAALLAAAGRAAKDGVLVRRIRALEALAAVDTVVFDKTGTLTEDRMQLGLAQTRPGASLADARSLAAAMAAHSLHPAALALRDETLAGAWLVRDVQEVAGCGLEAQVAPSTQEPETHWFTVRLGSPQFCHAPEQEHASSQVCLSDPQGWLAAFDLHETVRPQAPALLQALRARGLAVHVWSGDTPAAVALVATALGLPVGPSGAAVGGCSPQDKLDRLRALQAQGLRVAMVGDGLNDAPALAGADVSFAVGQALPLARAQADFVLLHAQLNAVGQTHALSKRAMRVVRQNLGWAVAYNLLCVPLAVIGWMPAWLAGLGMAASSLFVVLHALRLSRPASPSATRVLAPA